MMYQVVLKRRSPNGGLYFDRPYGMTNDPTSAHRQMLTVKLLNNAAEVAILRGESGAEIEEQYIRFKNGRSFNAMNPDVEREAVEMAPLRAAYPVVETPSIADIPMPAAELRGIVRLMLATAAGEKGGPHDGAE